MRSKLGMSLAETVIAMGMFGGLVMLATQTIVWQNKFVANVRGSQNLTSIAEQMSVILADEGSCTETFNPSPPLPPQNINPVAGTNFTEIRRKDEVGTVTTLFTVGDLFLDDTIEITGFSVSNFQITKAANRGIATVSVEAKPKIGLVTGVTVSQDFIIEVELDGTNKIINCAGKKESYAQTICKSLGGVILNNKCRDLNITDSLRATGNITATTANVNTPLFQAPTTVVNNNANVDLLNVGKSVYTTGDINVHRLIPADGNRIALMYMNRVVTYVGQICLNGHCRTLKANDCPVVAGIQHVAYGINPDGSFKCAAPQIEIISASPAVK